MKRRTIVILGLGVFLGASVTQGLELEWEMRVRVGQHVATFPVYDVGDISLVPVPWNMVRVSKGYFRMGDEEAWCGWDEPMVRLTHDFRLARLEVTNEQYRRALQWAYDNGYVDADMSSV